MEGKNNDVANYGLWTKFLIIIMVIFFKELFRLFWELYTISINFVLIVFKDFFISVFLLAMYRW